MRAPHRGRNRNYPEHHPKRGSHTEGLTRESHGNPGFKKARDMDLMQAAGEIQLRSTHAHPEGLCMAGTLPGPGTADTIVAQFHFDASGEDDGSNNWVWGLWSAANGGSVQSGSLNPGISMNLGVSIPAAAATDFRVTGRLLNRSLSRNPSGVQFKLYFRNATPTVLGTLTYTTTGTGFETFDLTGTSPSGTTNITMEVPYSLAALDDVILTLDGSGSADTPGIPGVHPDMVGDGVLASRCGHSHHVMRDHAPGVTDDAAHLYPEGTFWLWVDDEANPTQFFGRFVSTDDTDGAAVWLQETPPAHVHAPEDIVGSPSSAVVAHGAMGAVETFDYSDGSFHTATMDDDTAITLTGDTTDESADLVLRIVNDGIAGYLPSFTGTVIGSADVIAGWNQEPNGLNIVTAFTDGLDWYVFLAGAGGSVAEADVRDAGRWEPVTNGDVGTPEIVFDDGDVVMEWISG